MIYARIKQHSTRYRDWIDVVGSNRVPIQSPFPHRATSPDHPEGADFYALATVRLTSDQFIRLCGLLAIRFGYDPIAIRQEIEQQAMVPILAEDVIVEIENAAFL